jgi:hypothetical protein
MNELTEKILGAVGLGLAGLIATLFLAFNERFKKWLQNLLDKPLGRSLNSGSSGSGQQGSGQQGSGQQEQAAQERGQQGPIQSIHLMGHWTGDRWSFSLNGHLHRTQASFEGQFEWTLQGFPEDYEYPRWAKNRVGKSGTEFVRGTCSVESFGG